MKKLIILCVDDEATVLKSIREQLKRHFDNKKFQIEIAEGGEEALEIIDLMEEDQNTVVIVISDWIMPGMKGDEFLGLVHKKNPHAIKVILTGHTDEEALKEAKVKGNLYECIHKPWDEANLVEIIEQGVIDFEKKIAKQNMLKDQD